MNYGQRLAKAMDGHFASDRALAQALTTHLRRHGRLQGDKEIPEQTVQSARKRIKEDGGLSKYTLDFAFLCEVSPYWLAFELGPMRPETALRLPADPKAPQMELVWSALTSAQRERLIGFAQALAGQPSSSDETADSMRRAKSSRRKSRPFANATATANEKPRRAG